MIQDIHPHRFSNLYLANRTPQDDDYIFHYQGNTILLKTKGGELVLPQKKNFPEIPAETDFIFLFSLDEVPCFLVWDELKIDETQMAYTDISFFRSTTQREIGWVSLVGLHLRNWYQQNRFCGTCGAHTRHKFDERAVVCPACNAVVYPKISPAIIVAILSNDKILLARNSNFVGGWYSLVAGFVDVGETLEETVRREVKEEVGLDVWNIRYYKSQPWELSGSMMIGFIAEADENQPICIDEKEITAAAWFTRENLPNHPLNISIAGEMIEKFERGEL
ncbi:MAG: NAD(+) diphosphatase [Prolixibacteraceae bacterium]|nr:NAD(+) diphosphatase [Prolixibacteraceae bacterium]